MGRSVIGLGAVFGTTLGGYLPVLWGASSFGVVSLVFAAAGGLVGVFFTARFADV